MPLHRATAEGPRAGVESFLCKDVLPQLSAASIFKRYVAVNMLGIVQRELAQGFAASTE